MINIDGGDFTGKFFNCCGPNVGAEILTTQTTTGIKAVLFYETTDSDSKARIMADAMTPGSLDSRAVQIRIPREAAADGDSTLTAHSE